MELCDSTLVTSRLDYSYAIYMELLLKTFWKVRLVPNAEIQLLLDTIPLKKIHWLPVGLQTHVKVLVSAVTLKAVRSLGPGYLKDHLPYLISHKTHLRGSRCPHCVRSRVGVGLMKGPCLWGPSDDDDSNNMNLKHKVL